MYAYPDLYPATWVDQVTHGMNTAVVSANGDDLFGAKEDQTGFSRQIEGMLDAGLISPDCPVLASSLDSQKIRKAESRATRPWPELLRGSRDEPKPEHIEEVIGMAHEANEMGLRTATAVAAHNLLAPCNSRQYGNTTIADWLDVVIISASTWDDDIVSKLVDKGKEVWAYWCQPNADNDAARIRYLAGLWAWKTKPQCMLFWAYTHQAQTRVTPRGEVQHAAGDDFSYVIPTVDGPRETPGYAALAEGIKDHLALDALEANGEGQERYWLTAMQASIPARMPAFPAPVPRTDLDSIRSYALGKPEEKKPTNEKYRDPDLPAAGMLGVTK
jgi:hypothetical protein